LRTKVCDHFTEVLVGIKTNTNVFASPDFLFEKKIDLQSSTRSVHKTQPSLAPRKGLRWLHVEQTSNDLHESSGRQVAVNFHPTLPLKPPKTSHKLPVKKNGTLYGFQALTKNLFFQEKVTFL